MDTCPSMHGHSWILVVSYVDTHGSHPWRFIDTSGSQPCIFIDSCGLYLVISFSLFMRLPIDKEYVEKDFLE